MIARTREVEARKTRAMAQEQLEQAALQYARVFNDAVSGRIGAACLPVGVPRAKKDLVCAAMTFVAAQCSAGAVAAREAGDEAESRKYQDVAEELIDMAIELGRENRRAS